jgi:chromosome segregation ATPase
VGIEARVSSLESRGDALQKAASRSEAASNDLERSRSQLVAELTRVKECLPDLQRQIELLDVRDGSGGTFMQFETVASQVSRCRDLLRVSLLGAD